MTTHTIWLADGSQQEIDLDDARPFVIVPHEVDLTVWPPPTIFRAPADRIADAVSLRTLGGKHIIEYFERGPEQHELLGRRIRKLLDN